MTRTKRLAAAVCTLAVAALFGARASAQYSNQYTPPKLLRQGTTTKAIAGTGTVVVQVRVNANGTHEVMRVLRTSNRADDAAAIDIAKNSAYRVGTRGNKPTTAFYDFTLKFTGKAVASSVIAGESGPTAQIGRMIRAGNYTGAQAKVTAYLALNPSDAVAQQELGAADFFLNDYAGAAAAFDKSPTLLKEYRQVAAHAYALAAVKTENDDPAQAVAWGKKAVALDPSGNSYYALGTSEYGAGDAAAAVADLKRARSSAFANSKTSARTKVIIDTSLLAAYLKAGDMADATGTTDEMKRLDPSSTAAARVLGNHYLELGIAAGKAKKHDGAIAYFEQAAEVGDPVVVVTAYTQAAFQESNRSTPNYTKMKGYADKALAAKADDPLANFAEGVALAGEWATAGRSNPDLKKQSMAALAKADTLAKAAGNTSLSLQIENFIKSTFK